MDIMDGYSMPTKNSSGCSLESECDGRFWMVWNVNGRAPTMAHPSEEAANNEATRLARIAPGHTFVVLEARHAFKMVEPTPPPVERIPLNMIDHIPF
jgi:hypothetical protein